MEKSRRIHIRDNIFQSNKRSNCTLTFSRLEKRRFFKNENGTGTFGLSKDTIFIFVSVLKNGMELVENMKKIRNNYFSRAEFFEK